MKVLVVDDDVNIRKLVSAWLGRAGCTVIAAEDAYQATQFARCEQPAVILLDVHMPAGLGFTVHDRLRKLSATAGTPVVYMSADKTAGARAMAARAAQFLAKPLEREALLEAVCNAVGSDVVLR